MKTSSRRSSAPALSQHVRHHSCMDAAVGMHSHFREIGAYFAPSVAPPAGARLDVACSAIGPKSIVPQAFAAGLVTGTGHDLLRVGPVKIFTDGSAGGRTAWMSQPYLARKTCGVSCRPRYGSTKRDGYHPRAIRWRSHAIGDAAIDGRCSVLEEALAAAPEADRRHRIEHCGFLSTITSPA